MWNHYPIYKLPAYRFIIIFCLILTCCDNATFWSEVEPEYLGSLTPVVPPKMIELFNLQSSNHSVRNYHVTIATQMKDVSSDGRILRFYLSKWPENAELQRIELHVSNLLPATKNHWSVGHVYCVNMNVESDLRHLGFMRIDRKSRGILKIKQHGNFRNRPSCMPGSPTFVYVVLRAKLGTFVVERLSKASIKRPYLLIDWKVPNDKAFVPSRTFSRVRNPLKQFPDDPLFANIQSNKFITRTARSLDTDSIKQPNHKRQNLCQREPMMVDFKRIGWNDWIILPSRYDAGLCRGHCPFPLSKTFNPTNHAVIRQVLRRRTRSLSVDRVSKPCCVPLVLKPLQMLYFDEANNIILGPFEDMIVDSCRCA